MTIRRGLATAAVVLLLCACGEHAGASDVYQPLPAPEPTSHEFAAPSAQAERQTSGQQAPLDEEEVRSYFEAFELVRNEVVFGDRDAEDLEEWAEAHIVAETMLTRRSNDDLRARGDTTAISSTNTFGNVLGLSWLESPLAALTSCSEVHEEFENGDRSIRFIDHRLVFDTSHSPWRVTDREMRHDGQPGDGLGCAPSSFASRSLTAIDAAVPAADAAFADPAGVSATGLHRIFGGRLEEELNQIVAMLNETRSKRVSDRVFRSEVIGLDPAQPDFMVVVSVCSYYPDGVVGESATGEKTTIAGYEPGTSEEDWLYVWLEPILHGNAIVAGIEPGKSRDCWEQQ